MTKTIGEKILELRKQHSLTQEKLGEQLGISSQAVSKWENGDSMPDIMVLPQLCEVLEISVDALLEVEHSMKKENILKSFRDYAKEVGTHNALMEAFTTLIKVPVQVAHNTFIDISAFPNMSNGSYIKPSPNHIEISDADGMGFVISNKEYMDKIRDFDVKKLMRFFEIFSNEEMMTVIKELLHAGGLSKEEIIEKTNYSPETINQILLYLTERKVCIGHHRNRTADNVYTVNIGATSFHMALTAFYITYPNVEMRYIGLPEFTSR